MSWKCRRMKLNNTTKRRCFVAKVYIILLSCFANSHELPESLTIYLNVTDDGHHAGAVVSELLEVVVDDSMQPNTQLGQHKLNVFAVQRFADFNELKNYGFKIKLMTHYRLEF
jgi:hypothetical protein